jgi:hypothetical protein
MKSHHALIWTSGIAAGLAVRALFSTRGRKFGVPFLMGFSAGAAYAGQLMESVKGEAEEESESESAKVKANGKGKKEEASQKKKRRA